ncbi:MULTISPECIES: helix-turn-helix domain-containing protein [Burkholderia]|uniref:helix-turn-helix domain-containing protein n=1 Tax=Burkholderia orbicola TaxID=2978683 RepID=UPI002FE2AAC1
MTTIHSTPTSLTARHIEAVLPTDEAAAALNRKPQTLRKWACLENGPLRPVRINGRLAWRVSDIQALLSGEVA